MVSSQFTPPTDAAGRRAHVEVLKKMATIPPQFTIVSCVKSRAELQSIEHAAVVRDFLPSLVKTVTLEERRAWVAVA